MTLAHVYGKVRVNISLYRQFRFETPQVSEVISCPLYTLNGVSAACEDSLLQWRKCINAHNKGGSILGICD